MNMPMDWLWCLPQYAPECPVCSTNTQVYFDPHATWFVCATCSTAEVLDTHPRLRELTVEEMTVIRFVAEFDGHD